MSWREKACAVKDKLFLNGVLIRVEWIGLDWIVYRCSYAAAQWIKSIESLNEEEENAKSH